MGRPSSFKAEWGPAICMVLIELFTTGQMLLTKVVVDAGLFVFALLTYRFFLGTVLVIPLAIIFERSVYSVPPNQANRKLQNVLRNSILQNLSESGYCVFLSLINLLQ